MAAAQSFFKTKRHIKYAQERTETNTAEYIAKHRAFFGFAFVLIIGLLLLYALASSVLLGLGGDLVIKGELSIGQLVAAELILTAIFFGLSKAGNYLKLFYELCGAADELGLVFAMPINERMSLEHRTIPKDSSLTFTDVRMREHEKSYNLNFDLQSGAKLFVVTNQAWLQRNLIYTLRYHKSPDVGHIRLGGHDITEYQNQQYNNPPVAMVNKAPIIECTVIEFLKLHSDTATLADIIDILNAVGLEQVVSSFDHGMDTKLAALGSPFQPHEFLLLKLAAVDY